ncbi:unnamed protein product [Caenorhabditis bovis]|uniref:BTB domain-containing protein n=1 Tax=Caenorhabditis bovis TaxID=2654633 RepID=A0A8S1FDY8_9PELO|nr:unnamed protein product [Caenorhabditis bovis]
MTKKRKFFGNPRRKDVLEIVKIIGKAAGHNVLIIDGEIKARTKSTYSLQINPNAPPFVMRQIGFAGIPFCIVSAKGSGQTKEMAESAAAQALLDYFQFVFPDNIYEALRCVKNNDILNPEIQAVMPMFRILEELLKTDFQHIAKLGQYFRPRAKLQETLEIRHRIKTRIYEMYQGPSKQENKFEVLQVDECVLGEEVDHNDPHDDDNDDEDAIIIDVQRITSTKKKARPKSTLIETCARLRELRDHDIKQQQICNKEILESCSNMAQFNRNRAGIWQNAEIGEMDFGPMNTTASGPPAINACSVQPNTRRKDLYNAPKFEIDSSDYDSDYEPASKKPKTSKRNDELKLNIVGEKRASDGDQNTSIDEIEEVALVDEWDENDDDGEKVVKIEEKDDEEEDDDDVIVLNEGDCSSDGDVLVVGDVKSGRSSFGENSMNQERFEKGSRSDATDIYDGEPDVECLGTKHNWPKDYEKNLIGVIYNAEIAKPVEKFVLSQAQTSFDSVKKLGDNVWHHYLMNSQTFAIYKTKMEVREKLLGIFQKIYREKKLLMHVTGSSVNGCGAYNSDVDMCLCIPKLKNGKFFDDFPSSLSQLRAIQRILSRAVARSEIRKLVRKTTLIPAVVPILKVDLQPPYENLDIDININNIAGIYNSHLLHYYSQIDGRFPALALVVKHWAIRNEIGDAQYGTFNSYSLILLVIHYLQCGVRPAVLPNLQHIFPEKFDRKLSLENLVLFGNIIDKLPDRPPNTWSLGELTIGFFNYYARFPFNKYAISIRSGQIFPRKYLPRSDHYHVFIEEPFDACNTARCIRNDEKMRKVKDAFQYASARNMEEDAIFPFERSAYWMKVFTYSSKKFEKRTVRFAGAEWKIEFSWRNVDLIVSCNSCNYSGMWSYQTKITFSNGTAPLKFKYTFGKFSRPFSTKNQETENGYELKIEVLNVEGDPLLNWFNLLHRQPELADVVLVVSGNRLKANKIQLATISTYFHAMFFGSFEEEKKKEVEIKDVDFEEFVHTLNVALPPNEPVTENYLDSLLEVANQFDIANVLSLCERFMMAELEKEVSIFKAREYLKYSDDYSLDKLQNVCLHALEKNTSIYDKECFLDLNLKTQLAVMKVLAGKQCT